MQIMVSSIPSNWIKVCLSSEVAYEFKSLSKFSSMTLALCFSASLAKYTKPSFFGCS